MKFFFFFVVLLCASVPAAVTAADGCHSDRDTDHRVRLNCTAAGLDGIPADLEPTIEVLLFPRNQFSSLSWASFQIFSKLHELDLTANEVGELTASDAPLLPSLSVLRLGSNHLTSLVRGAFSACPALTNLYLDNNTIESLSQDAFAGLSKLEILDLTSNRIRVLPPLLLRPLVAIETLYLENNQISTLPDDWFNPREDVPYLYLSANPWSCDCGLTYLHMYLGDFYFNFYVRDGKIILRDAKSVVCHSPQRFKGQAVMDLDPEDLCPPSPEPQTMPLFTGPTDPVVESGGPRGDGPVVWQPARTTSSTSFPEPSGTTTALPRPTTPTASLPTTESIPTTESLPPTAPLPTTASHPPTPTLRTALPVVTPTSSEVPRTRQWVRDEGAAIPLRGRPSAGVLCVWLLAGYACLCAMGAVSSLVTIVRLVVLYRGAYKPLRVALASAGGIQQVRLCGGATAVYRSVLFVSCNEEETVYRTTLHRAPGTQVALQQWSDVVGRRQDGAGWRQRFSVLLRQEREGPDGGREERDWVVGSWLAQHLPECE